MSIFSGLSKKINISLMFRSRNSGQGFPDFGARVAERGGGGQLLEAKESPFVLPDSQASILALSAALSPASGGSTAAAPPPSMSACAPSGRGGRDACEALEA